MLTPRSDEELLSTGIHFRPRFASTHLNGKTRDWIEAKCTRKNSDFRDCNENNKLFSGNTGFSVRDGLTGRDCLQVFLSATLSRAVSHQTMLENKTPRPACDYSRTLALIRGWIVFRCGYSSKHVAATLSIGCHGGTIICRLDIHVRRRDMKHSRIVGCRVSTAGRQCDGDWPNSRT